jgi:hypothetical protein
MKPELMAILAKAYPLRDVAADVASDPEIAAELERVMLLTARECVALCGSTATPWPYALKACQDTIKKHFDLE